MEITDRCVARHTDSCTLTANSDRITNKENKVERVVMIDISEWIAIVIALATCIISLTTSIAAWRSANASNRMVQEMSQQTSRSYEPQLLIAETLFRSHCENEHASSHRWEKIEVKDQQLTPITSTDCFSVTLMNVGFGTAKNLTVNWTFAISELIASVNQLAQESLTPAHFRLRNGILEIKGAQYIMWMNERQRHLDFIMPARDTKNSGVDLVMPRTYIQLVSAFVHLTVRQDSPTHEMVIPQLECHIKYDDISGVAQSTTITLRPVCHIIEHNTGFDGSIEVYQGDNKQQ